MKKLVSLLLLLTMVASMMIALPSSVLASAEPEYQSTHTQDAPLFVTGTSNVDFTSGVYAPELEVSMDFYISSAEATTFTFTLGNSYIKGVDETSWNFKDEKNNTGKVVLTTAAGSNEIGTIDDKTFPLNAWNNLTYKLNMLERTYEAILTPNVGDAFVVKTGTFIAAFRDVAKVQLENKSSGEPKAEFKIANVKAVYTANIVSPTENAEVTEASTKLSAYVKDSVAGDVKFFVNDKEVPAALDSTSGNWEADYTITSNGEKRFDVVYTKDGAKHIMSTTFNANVPQKTKKFLKKWDGEETAEINVNTFTSATATGKDGTTAVDYTVTGQKAGFFEPVLSAPLKGRVCYEADLKVSDTKNYHITMEFLMDITGDGTYDSVRCYGIGTGTNDISSFKDGKIANNLNYENNTWVDFKYVMDFNSKNTEIWVGGVKIAEAPLTDNGKQEIPDTTDTSNYGITGLRLNYKNRGSATETTSATVTVDNVHIYEESVLPTVTEITYGSSATAPTTNNIISADAESVAITFDKDVTGDVKINGTVDADASIVDKTVTVSLADVDGNKITINAGGVDILLYRANAGANVYIAPLTVEGTTTKTAYAKYISDNSSNIVGNKIYLADYTGGDFNGVASKDIILNSNDIGIITISKATTGDTVKAMLWNAVLKPLLNFAE